MSDLSNLSDLSDLSDLSVLSIGIGIGMETHLPWRSECGVYLFVLVLMGMETSADSLQGTCSFPKREAIVEQVI